MEKFFDDMTHKEKSQAKKIAELLDIEGYVQFGLKYKEICGKKIIDFFIVRGGKLKPKWGLLLEKGHGIEFRNCKFPKSIEIEVKDYKYHLGFCKCVFEKDFNMSCCVFQRGISFYDEDKKEIERSIFKGKVIFTDSVFGTNCKEEMQSIKASFKKCVFKKEVKFDNVMTHIPVYFNHAEFYKNADFHESRFEDVACFYCAKFFEAPNFSQTIFNGSPNFVSSKINFTFGGLKDFIKRKAVEDEDKEDKTANDYRDSFRLVKNALIKENDILNASQYHKMELYCKEIELESKRQKSLSDWLEKWQLWFYRNTSDHHTNLLRIIAWVVACIGLFGYVLLGIFASDEKIAEFVAKLNSAFIALVYCIFLYSSCYLFYGECWRKIVICLCWILAVSFAVLVLSSHPNYLIDLFKGCLRYEDFAWWQNIILLVHVILLGLLLFSLQKTARKNSIIPS